MTSRNAVRDRVSIVIMVAAVAWAGWPGAAGSSTARAAAPDVGPWLARHCGDCHAGGSKEGGVSLEGVKTFTDASPDTWAAIHEQLQLALMPPKDQTQPPAAERAKMVAWVADSMRKAGHHVRDKLALPNYGNYVPHEPLFRGEAHAAPATPVRAWRVRPDVYRRRVPEGSQPFSLLSGQHVMDYGTLYELDESAAEVVLANAQGLVEKWTATVTKDGKRTPVPGARPDLVALLDPAVDPAAGKLDASVKGVFETAVGRSPSADELERMRTVFKEIEAQHGRDRALRMTLTYPYLLPEAYYRLEIGEGEPDQHGRRRLPKPAIVMAIQQTLFGNDRPQKLQAVLADAEATLGSREEVAKLVRELLDLPGVPVAPPAPQLVSNARVLRFFDEYFDYRKAPDVFKEPQAGTPHQPASAVNDTARLIDRIVADDRDVFRRLLTTREAFVTGRGDHVDIGSYNLPGDFKGDGLVTLDEANRCGILTQPSWLVAYSGNFDNDPVRRGKWVLEHLLGGTVADVPVTVCAKVPDDPKRTLRDRFTVVSGDSYCWKCHEQMNQLGMSFEIYDQFGRHRFRELNKPVDSSGAVVASGDASLDGPVKNAIELIERLAKSQRAEEMFVRYAFRFFMGRNETLRDAQTLREAQAAYAGSQGSMKALVTSLLSSDSFLYRLEQAK